MVILINHAPTNWGDLCKNFITAGVSGVGSEIEIEVASGVARAWGVCCWTDIIDIISMNQRINLKGHFSKDFDQVRSYSLRCFSSQVFGIFFLLAKQVFFSFKTTGHSSCCSIYFGSPHQPKDSGKWWFRLRFCTKNEIILVTRLHPGCVGVYIQHVFPPFCPPWGYPRPLGCPVGSDRINLFRISGLFHLLINGVYWGEFSPTDPKQMDPNFLGHPYCWWKKSCTS